MKSLILAIESSCDETGIAVIENGNIIRSNVVVSQIDIHKAFGGVIPEVASRKHTEVISVVLKQAISEANINVSEIDAVAYTVGPGLIGALHIGAIAAKTIALILNTPLIATNHIFGHIMANKFVAELKFPLLAVIVSGGHTELISINESFEYSMLGTTQDDAIGEAYDKVARLLNLGYPGGKVIDDLSKVGQPIYPLPVAKTESKLDFSFSGLKSAVLQLIKREEKKGNVVKVEDVAASFQEAAVSQIISRVDYALKQGEYKQVVVGGGVAANSYLREEIVKLVKGSYKIEAIVPPMKYCTDNGAMIGAAAHELYIRGKFSNFDQESKSSNITLI